MAKEKKEKKKGKAKWIVLAFVVIVIIAAVAGGGKDDDSTADNTDQDTQQSQQQEQTGAKKEYNIGETWTVDGQWNLTVTGVEATQERNQYSDKDPGAVYIVNFTYENTGYEDENGLMDGLYIDMEDTIVDAAGTMGYSYPVDVSSYARETPVGATCNAQVCIGVDNPGDFKITVNKYDGHGEKRSATFNLSVS